MLIIELTYKKSLEEANQHLDAHRHFLDQCYEEGLLIASGAKVPRDGGIIIATSDRHLLEERLKADPFYQHEIADYKIIEFTPSKSCQALRDLLGLQK